MQVIKKLFLSILLIVLTISCSLPKTVELDPSVKTKQLRMSFSRSSTNSIDFEQYALKSKFLVTECGQVVRGRYKAKRQNVIALKTAAYEKINASVQEILAHQAELPSSADNNNFLDPGKFELQIETNKGGRSISTSFDEISGPSSKLSRALQKLTKDIRGFNKSHLCGLKEFYGLGYNE